MSYSVKEIFHTIQGEGANIGRAAVFIRFAGCNLWSGREADRATAACSFCDTDFVGGERIQTAKELASRATAFWPIGKHHRFVVLTGGEPLLQVDAALLKALKDERFHIAVETNGTLPLPGHIDWLCVSPKGITRLALSDADELKLVYPQREAFPERFAEFKAVHRWLSPMAGPNLAENTEKAAKFCRDNPEWRLAIQAHKFWRIP